MGVIVGDYFGISIERLFPRFPTNHLLTPHCFGWVADMTLKQLVPSCPGRAEGLDSRSLGFRGCVSCFFFF